MDTKETKRVPQRICAGCMQMKPKKELIRAVKPPVGEIFVDLTGKAAGRGCYICKNAECLKKAQKARRLEKNFKGKISESIFSKLEEQLANAK
jgi:predicted RNA-binding protein YlxR (DUF448 family)